MLSYLHLFAHESGQLFIFTHLTAFALAVSLLRVQIYGGRNMAYDDISIGGLGWISVSGTGLKVFDVWVPKGVKVFRRPAMLPKQIQETGVDTFRGKSPR